MLALGLAACDRVFSLRDRPLGPDAAGDAQAGGLRLVQDKADGLQSGTSLSLELDAAPTPGNAMVLVGGAERGALMAPTGGGVSRWYEASRVFGNQNLEIWYGVVEGPDAPVDIMTSAPAGRIRMSVSEWSGLNTAALFELGLANEGTATTASAGPITTLDAPDLLIFGVASPGNISTTVTGGEAGGTWTMLASPPPIPLLVQSTWYQVVSVAGTYAAQTQTMTDWDAGIAAFRIAP